MPARPEPLTASERSLRARMAAHARHAQIDDPTAATAPGRKAFMDKFEKQVDPDGLLTPKEQRTPRCPRPQVVLRRAGVEELRARARRKAGAGGDAA